MDSFIVQRLAEVALDMAETLRPDVLTLQELAHRMQMHPKTVAKKIHNRSIPLRPVAWSDYRLLFLRRDVDRFLGVVPATRHHVA